jgi:hypothetical protein
MKKIVFGTIVLALMAVAAQALPTFGPDGGARLQGVLNDITTLPTLGVSSVNVLTDALDDTVDSYWSITGTGGSFSTVVFKVTEAGYEDVGYYGVYDYADPTKTIQLFDGSTVAPGDQATMSIKLDGSVWVNLTDTGIKFAGNQFGYYFDTRTLGAGGGGFWYSDSALNTTDSASDHMYAYQGTNTDTVQIGINAAGLWTNNEYILGWELGKITGGSDRDYDDLVIMIESVNPTIPAPGAILLGSMGVGLVGWLKRRRSL